MTRNEIHHDHQPESGEYDPWDHASTLGARDDLARQLDRTSKRDLIAIAKTIAEPRGDRWLIGGPDDWSKDELINYIVG